jgi:hypothetical protein
MIDNGFESWQAKGSESRGRKMAATGRKIGEFDCALMGNDL